MNADREALRDLVKVEVELQISCCPYRSIATALEEVFLDIVQLAINVVGL